MNTLAAIRDTIQLAYEKAAPTSPFLSMEGPSGYKHMLDMYRRVEKDKMSEGKLNRWLGFMQGVLVTYGIASLDEVKAINKKHAD